MSAKRVVFLILFVAACGKVDVVQQPSRPQTAKAAIAPFVSADVEATMAKVCSPTSHFGEHEASDAVGLPMRWENPAKPGEEGADCGLTPPADTEPSFILSVTDIPPDDFERAMTSYPDAKRDEDPIPNATHTAWSAQKLVMYATDDRHVVMVSMAAEKEQGPNSLTHARMQATTIASKVLATLGAAAHR